MKYRLVNLLACPMCRYYPLELIVFNEKKYEKRKLEWTKPVCDLYCAFKKAYVKDLKSDEIPCEECIKYEIVDGIIICPKCNRWYPVLDEIPRMLPDELRKKKDDLEFLRTFKDKIPEKVLLNGKPFNLKEELVTHR